MFPASTLILALFPTERQAHAHILIFFFFYNVSIGQKHFTSLSQDLLKLSNYETRHFKAAQETSGLTWWILSVFFSFPPPLLPFLSGSLSFRERRWWAVNWKLFRVLTDFPLRRVSLRAETLLTRQSSHQIRDGGSDRYRSKENKTQHRSQLLKWHAWVCDVYEEIIADKMRKLIFIKQM